MSDTSELDRLIVERLTELDAAAKHIEEIGKRVWNELDGVASSWAKEKGWVSEYDGDEDLWVAPQAWMKQGEPEAWFGLGWGPDDTGEGVSEEAYFYLSRFCGTAGGRLCLWLGWEGVGARTWKPIARAAADDLQRLGFTLSDKAKPYTDCTLTQSLMAEGLADDDLTQAVQPFRLALDRAAAAQPLLEGLLSQSRR